jgi:hypothetical protein
VKNKTLTGILKGVALAISWLTLSPLLLILDGRGMKTAMPLTSSLTSILVGWCFIIDLNYCVVNLQRG